MTTPTNGAIATDSARKATLDRALDLLEELCLEASHGRTYGATRRTTGERAWCTFPVERGAAGRAVALLVELGRWEWLRGDPETRCALPREAKP